MTPHSFLPAAFAALLLSGTTALAGVIPANNASFEEPPLSAGSSTTTLAGWSDAGTGVWTALGAGTNSQVRSLAVVPGGAGAYDVIAGGMFTTAGAEATNYIARWSGDSGNDGAWPHPAA